MSLFIFGTYPTGRVDVANEDGDVRRDIPREDAERLVRGEYSPAVGDLLVNDAKGSSVLVGDVNQHGGECDDCFGAPWDRDAIVYGTFDQEKRTYSPDWYRLDEGWRLDRNLLIRAKA